MLAEKLYHGTYVERGKRIIDTGVMDVSIGDNHWLGNGSYFFVEDFHAFKWIKEMYEDYIKKSRIPEDCKLEEYYMILCAQLRKNGRVFDLTKTEHKIIYDKVYLELSKKKVYSDRFRDDEIAEGVVINYMFEKLGCNNDYDFIRAIFMFNKKNYRGVPSRIGYMPQEQICVRNQNIVCNIENYDFSGRIPEYTSMLSNYYFSDSQRTTDKKKTVHYRPHQASYMSRKKVLK